MSDLPPICILAGGKGTRLGETVRDVPKPLLEVAGEPFLMHQLRLLSTHGARRVVLCVGYLGGLVDERIGNEQFGIEIVYSFDSPAFSTSWRNAFASRPVMSADSARAPDNLRLKRRRATSATRCEE